MPTLERISRRSEARDSERSNGTVRALRGRQDGFGPAPSNQALRRLIEKKKRKQETQREAEPESPHEIAIQIQKHLENDPGDTSGRMRSQLEAMEPEKRQEVVARLRDRTSTAGKERLAEVLSEPAPKAVEAPAGKPEGKKQVEEAQQEQEQEKEKLEAKTAEPPAPPAEPEPEAPEKKEEKARQEDKKKKEEKPPVAEAKAETEKAAAARVKKDRVEETRPVETPEAALEKAAKAPGIGEKKPAEAAKKPEEVLKPSPEAEAGKKPEEKALAPGAAPSAKAQAEKAAPGKAEPEKAEAKPGEAPPPQAGVPELAEQAKQKAAKAEKPTGKPSAGATEKGQAQQAEALQGMPAAARGEAGAAAPAPPGPAAQKAAAQPAPAVGGATAAEVAGGGGDGGEAALEAEPEGGPAAAEGDKATEKMDEAEPAAEEEPAPEGQEPSEPAAETAGPPSSEEKEEAKAADEQDKQIAAAGGTPDVAAPGEEEEGEEGVTASKVELPGPEKEAGLATLAEGGRGGGEPAGGGGGGGGAITEQPEPTPPDVSGAEPAAAMSSLSGLKVGAIAQAMGGVSAAISKTAGDQKQELAANPPTMERPSGSPVTRDGPISAQYPPEGGEGKAAAVEQVPEGEAVAVPEPEPVPEPGPDPTEAVAAPPVTGGEDGTMTEADAANVENAVRDMPTSDPEIETNAGPSPTLQLEGDADPQQARDQRAELDKTAADQQAQGAEDVAKPMGEDEVYPTVPKETLEGQVPAGAGGGEGGGQAAGADDETAGIVAEEKEGDAVRSSVQQASTDMAAKQQQHIEDQAEKRSDTDKEIADTVAENTSLQTEERQAAKRQVGEHRSQWSEGQQQAVDKAQTDADREGEKLDTDVAAKQEEANTKAQEEIDSGTQKAEAERQAGEAKAESEKQKAEKESDGIFGWLASKATAFFNALKKAVSAVISAMRKAVKAAIEFAKKAALAAIDLARKAIVGLIKLAGEALMAIGDVLLAAFPSLRAKFRKLIQKAVAAAEDAVNRLADGLKKAVAAALDALGAALDALLGLLEKGLLAVLDAANKVVQAAIKAAQAVIAALAAFAAIIKDVAANPGQWISNLGAAVIDGIKNHLWKAFKAAIKNWFEQKLTQILGIGMMIFQILMKGGIKLAEVGKMAFEGLKAAIPTALIGILVEKLVAMIVPAAGAVMAIIEGLQAAWGTISRILAAISKFVSFLRAVKSGTAGPRFAEMLASAAIIVIDFVANWLIKRIRGPASKIGGKVKAIARKILEKLKKIAKKIVKAVKKVIDKVKRGLKKIFGKKKKKSKKKDKRDQDKAKERLDKAVSALRPKLAAMLSNPVSSIMLRAKLAFWRLRYRIKVLSLTKSGQQASINAANSPSIEVITAVDANQELVMKIVREAGEAIMTDNKVRALAKDILKQRKAGLGTTDPRVLPMSPNIPVAATELGMAAPKPWTTTRMEMSPGGVLLPVSERQLFTSGPPSTWVIGAGKTADVQATVSELGGPKAVAAAFFAAQTGGKPTGLKGGAAGVVSFGEIMRLMAVETARDPHGELSRLTMRMSEAERGGTTAQQLVRERNPIGERGGTGTAAFISREMDHEAPGKRVPTQAEVDTFVRQELALAAQFIHSTAVVDEKIGGTVVQITNFIKKKLKDKLITLMRQKYGL